MPFPSNRTKPTLIYQASDYDVNAYLKIPIIGWLIVAYLSAPLLVLIASVSNKSDRFGLLSMIYTDPLWTWLASVASIPALIIVYSWSKRIPGAPPHIFRIWRQGRTLLFVSLTMNELLVSLQHPWTSKVFFTQSCLYLLMIYYLIRSRRLRDTFADIPSESSKSN